MKTEPIEKKTEVGKNGEVSNGVHGPTSDDYIASIELSNKCREFYRSRLQAVESAKQKLKTNDNSPESGYCSASSGVSDRKTGVDNAMQTLRREMVRLSRPYLSLLSK